MNLILFTETGSEISFLLSTSLDPDIKKSILENLDVFENVSDRMQLNFS